MMQVLANNGKVSNWLALAIVAMGSLTIGWGIGQGRFP